MEGEIHRSGWINTLVAAVGCRDPGCRQSSGGFALTPARRSVICIKWENPRVEASVQKREISAVDLSLVADLDPVAERWYLTVEAEKLQQALRRRYPTGRRNIGVRMLRSSSWRQQVASRVAQDLDESSNEIQQAHDPAG